MTETIVVNIRNMCRICLGTSKLIDVLGLGDKTAQLMEDINRFFKVQISYHDDKPTKICNKCMHKIKKWRIDMQQAVDQQYVINFLEARYRSRLKKLMKRVPVQEMMVIYDDTMLK